MTDWNPGLYLQYGAERTRPALELLSRIALDNVTDVVDLGCECGQQHGAVAAALPRRR